MNSADLKEKETPLIRELDRFMSTQAEDDGLVRECRLRAFAAIEKTQKPNV